MSSEGDNDGYDELPSFVRRALSDYSDESVWLDPYFEYVAYLMDHCRIRRVTRGNCYLARPMGSLWFHRLGCYSSTCDQRQLRQVSQDPLISSHQRPVCTCLLLLMFSALLLFFVLHVCFYISFAFPLIRCSLRASSRFVLHI